MRCMVATSSGARNLISTTPCGSSTAPCRGGDSAARRGPQCEQRGGLWPPLPSTDTDVTEHGEGTARRGLTSCLLLRLRVLALGAVACLRARVCVHLHHVGVDLRVYDHPGAAAQLAAGRQVHKGGLAVGAQCVHN